MQCFIFPLTEAFREQTSHKTGRKRVKIESEMNHTLFMKLKCFYIPKHVVRGYKTHKFHKYHMK